MCEAFSASRFRNTSRHGRRAVLLGAAIAFGVMIITLLNAFTSGAIENIKSNLAYAVGGHVFISGTELVDGRREVDRIGDDTVLRAAVEQAGQRIESIHRRSTAFATLIFGSKTAVQAVEGVNFAEETEFSRGLQVREGAVVFDGNTDPRSLILPASAAERLGVQVGETVLVRLQTVTGQQNVGEFRVAAIVEELIGSSLSGAYTSLEYLNSLIGLAPGEYQLFNVVVRNVQDIDAVADDMYHAMRATGALVERPYASARSEEELEDESMQLIGQLFGQAGVRLVEEPWEGTKFSLTTLNEMMEPVVAAMGVLDAIARGIFVVLLVITAVGILNTFRMIMLERVREIGTMRAFGMQKGTVRGIFLWEAAIIAAAGARWGCPRPASSRSSCPGLTFPECRALSSSWTGGTSPSSPRPANLITNMLIVLVISLAAALLPANAAARLQPVEALGAHY